MQLQTYLTFDGRCEEAIEFYKKALGAKEDMLMRFRDSPEPMPPGMLPAGNENKVMHASFHIGETMVMADDGGVRAEGCDGERSAGFHGFSLSLSMTDESEARKRFEALAASGQVRMPLGKTFWSPLFGIVVDKFGVAWMINVMPPA